jgi:hypothetical protein
MARKIDVEPPKQTHTVSTDALATLGTIIDETAGRDAIHLAVEPIEAGEVLYPGQRVNLKDGKAYLVNRAKEVGIVDPFLSVAVYPGQRFWLVVNPRTITSLRHVWEHPAFPTGPKVDTRLEASKQWLTDYAHRLGISYDNLMRCAKNSEGEGYISTGDLDINERIDGAFYDHYEIVTGYKWAVEHQAIYFSCSC